MKNPAITVLMPVYNGEKYLKEAIESILNQTFTDFEFLIINDGSKDNSALMIKQYGDKRIKLIQHKANLGLIKTLNEGMKLAKGRYLARMDADDISAPTRLFKQFTFMEKRPGVAVCGSWARGIDENGKRTSALKAPSGLVMKYNYWKPSPIIHPSAFMRLSAVSKHQFDDNALHAEDYDFWLKVAKDSKLCNIREYLLNYRVHSGSISSKNREEQLKSSYRSFINHIADGLEITFEEFKSLSSLDYEKSAKIRIRALKKISRKIKIPHYFMLLDNTVYALKKKLYGKK